MIPEHVMERYGDVAAVSRYIGTTPRAVYHLVARRRIPFCRVGRRLVFDRVAVDAWLARNAVEARTDAGSRRGKPQAKLGFGSHAGAPEAEAGCVTDGTVVSG